MPTGHIYSEYNEVLRWGKIQTDYIWIMYSAEDINYGHSPWRLLNWVWCEISISLRHGWSLTAKQSEALFPYSTAEAYDNVTMIKPVKLVSATLSKYIFLSDQWAEVAPKERSYFFKCILLHPLAFVIYLKINSVTFLLAYLCHFVLI